MTGLELVVPLFGLIAPPVTDFIKKKFLEKEDDTVERTASALATTSPDTLPSYIEAMSKFTESRVGWFNRDVIGNPSVWVVDLRAAIRPITVAASLLIIAFDHYSPSIDTQTKTALLTNISNWFGDRMSKA